VAQARRSVANFLQTQTFDGDELYLLSIKEMATVMECMYIHPISTLLGGKDGVLDDVVCMTDEEAIAAGGWLLDGLSKPVEEYEKAFNAA